MFRPPVVFPSGKQSRSSVSSPSMPSFFLFAELVVTGHWQSRSLRQCHLHRKGGIPRTVLPPSSESCRLSLAGHHLYLRLLEARARVVAQREPAGEGHAPGGFIQVRNVIGAPGKTLRQVADGDSALSGAAAGELHGQRRRRCRARREAARTPAAPAAPSSTTPRCPRPSAAPRPCRPMRLMASRPWCTVPVRCASGPHRW